MQDIMDIWNGLDAATRQWITVAAAIGGALLVLRWLTSLVRRLLYRALGPYTVNRLGSAFSALIVIAGLAAGSIYFDRTGTVVPGQVVAREETIDINRGSWGRSLSLHIRYQTPSGGQLVTPVGVDEGIFDRTPQGASVRVRYVPQFPMLVRLEQQSTLSLLQTALPWTSTRMLALVVSAVLCLGLLLIPGVRQGWGRRSLPVFGLTILILAQLIASFIPPTLLAGPRHETTAEVQAVTRMTESWLSTDRSRYSLAQPYDLVQLVFEVPGRVGPVTAVDAIDIGSTNVAPGVRVPISYAEGAPREAQIVGAARGHVWKNWLETASPMLGALAAGLVWFALRDLIPWGRLAGRRRGPSAAWQEHLLDAADGYLDRRR